MPSPTIAFVYDRINTPYGGAEQVLVALHNAFPNAPFFTSVYDAQKATWAKEFDVRPSFLQTFPGAVKNHRLYAPLMPLAFESFDLSQYDIVISITSAEAKGVITTPDQLHICYLLTPTRYLYSHREEYEQSHWPFKVPILKQLSQKLFDYLTWWDQSAATRPDVIIPISNLVKQRIGEFYHRQTKPVIYPPIPKTSISGEHTEYETPDDYLLVMSRLVPYKRIDLIIKAAQQLKKDLIIIGEGPAEKELKALATETTSFLGSVSEKTKHALLSQAEAVVMPGIEDFGITAVETAMHGVPVILHQDSGAAELLPDKKAALHLKSLDEKNLMDAIEQLSHTRFSFTETRKNLQKYAITNFGKRFEETVFELWKAHQKGEL